MKPRETKMTGTINHSRQTSLVERVCRYIDDNLDGPLTLATLGEQAHVSPAHLQRVFKRALGISPRQYADARRLERVKKGLKNRKTVTAAMYEAGYGSSSRLYERAAHQLGMTPAAYQRGGTDVVVRFTVADCPLGRLLLAGTERGVCAVSLGDEDDGLEQWLRAEYPSALVEPDDGTLNNWLKELLRHLAGEQPCLDLPLDVQATAFQWRVWQELRRIPYGSTRSYHAIAEAIGQPNATRAVARACATNPVSVVIPCHRVIREDGQLGGYRWGLQRKKALLKQEQHRKQR
jgi:AraC family transcriptional regulator of adaptative response/methylated-DNA-[protein]-cysteine methyltransferase